MEQPNIETLLEQYQEELRVDVHVDEFSLKQKTLLIPTIKHKWVGRLITHKSQLRRLELARKKIVQEIIASSPIPLSKMSIDQAMANNPKVQTINGHMETLEIVIEYLEKVEKLTASLTWDCKNLIDLQKLETT